VDAPFCLLDPYYDALLRMDHFSHIILSFANILKISIYYFFTIYVSPPVSVPYRNISGKRSGKKWYSSSRYFYEKVKRRKVVWANNRYGSHYIFLLFEVRPFSFRRAEQKRRTGTRPPLQMGQYKRVTLIPLMYR